MNNTTEAAAISFGSLIGLGDQNKRLVAIAAHSKGFLESLSNDKQYQPKMVIGPKLRGEYDPDLWAKAVQDLSKKFQKPVFARQVPDSSLVSIGLDDNPVEYEVPLIIFDYKIDELGRTVLDIQPAQLRDGSIAADFFRNISD